MGTVMIGLGTLLIVGIQVQTRSHLRELLVPTQGHIRTDEQMQALNEVMTRGLILSIGGFGAIALGCFLGILGLVGLYRGSKEAPQGGL